VIFGAETFYERGTKRLSLSENLKTINSFILLAELKKNVFTKIEDDRYRKFGLSGQFCQVFG